VTGSLLSQTYGMGICPHQTEQVFGLFSRLPPQPSRRSMFECIAQSVPEHVSLARPWSFEAIILAVLLEQEKRIAELVERLDELDGGNMPSQGRGYWLRKKTVHPRNPVPSQVLGMIGGRFNVRLGDWKGTGQSPTTMRLQ
jgi:hypothetical protein